MTVKKVTYLSILLFYYSNTVSAQQLSWVIASSPLSVGEGGLLCIGKREAGVT
jgi:hypothetical protein